VVGEYFEPVAALVVELELAVELAAELEAEN
jgi:hypothetical protein